MPTAVPLAGLSGARPPFLLAHCTSGPHGGAAGCSALPVAEHPSGRRLTSASGPRGIRRLRPGPGGRRSVGSRRSARPPVWRNRAPGGWRAPKPWGTSRGRPRPASPMTRAPWARGFGVDRIGVRWPRKTPAGPGDLHPSRFFFFFQQW